MSTPCGLALYSERVLLRMLVATLAVSFAFAAPAGAEGRGDFGDQLSVAARALRAGEFARATELAERLAQVAGPARSPGAEATAPSTASRGDRAEAWRIFGLALFFEGELGRAEVALLEYLKLDEDAHLDPGLVPPEAIVFFEDVRSRHAAEIRAYHPDPEERRWMLLNLAPPAGQFQNDHRGKGWAIAGMGTALIGLNVGSYMALRRWCSGSTGVCGEEGERYRQARVFRVVNVASAVGLGAVYLYGVIDGFAGYGSRDRDVSITLMPGDISGIAVQGRF